MCLSFFNIFLSVLFCFFPTGTRFQFYRVVFSFLEQVNVLQSILNLNGIPCLSVLNKFWDKVNENVKFCSFNESSFVKTVATTTKLEMTNLSDYTRWYFAWHLPLKYTSVCVYIYIYMFQKTIFFPSVTYHVSHCSNNPVSVIFRISKLNSLLWTICKQNFSPLFSVNIKLRKQNSLRTSYIVLNF